MKLTKRTRFRSVNSLLVLQVEEGEIKLVDERLVTTTYTWRDARTEDLAELHELTYGRIDVNLPAVDEEIPDGTTKH